MGNKRRSTPHQKQIRFLTIFVGVIMIVTAIALILLLNRPPGAH